MDTKRQRAVFLKRDDMWRYFRFLPIKYRRNIVSFGEGRTTLTRVPELEKYLNSAKLYLKNEGENPTGTFKDREASFVISKAKEARAKKMVFHSTGNTGRAYAYYASRCGIESFFFLPLSCMEKCDVSIKDPLVHIIAVDGRFGEVGGIAKQFAVKNSFPIFAPLEDKIQGKATIAYEQLEELPETTIFAQTIAGGYGILGFFLGYAKLKEAGLFRNGHPIPKIVAIQLEEVGTLAKAINKGIEVITEKDLLLPKAPFEKTLQSTNPLKTFSEMKEVIRETNGTIETVTRREVGRWRLIFERALSKNNIVVSYRNEKSPYISFAGLVKLAGKKLIKDTDIIYMVITGRGILEKPYLIPEAIVRPLKHQAAYSVISSSKDLAKYI